jgi:hypothetical protein
MGRGVQEAREGMWKRKGRLGAPSRPASYLIDGYAALSLIHSRTFDSNHATLPSEICRLLGNFPAFTSLSICE